ncbi:MAG: hypothetical protein IT317_16220 [Anaerolineales bacterium]|nr:hypothetical protein [Anaerolineales bacterium]
MNAGESFQLSAAWWKKGKPLTLKPTGLGAALTAYERARAAYMGSQDNNLKFKVALDALDTVNDARLRAIALCGSSHADTKAALQKAAVIAAETQALLTTRSNQFKAPLRQLKSRVEDLKKHTAKLKTQVAAYEKVKVALDPKKRAANEKIIKLNLAYLNNAIQGGSSALQALDRQEQVLGDYFPKLAVEFKAGKTAFTTLRAAGMQLLDDYDEYA